MESRGERIPQLCDNLSITVSYLKHSSLMPRGCRLSPDLPHTAPPAGGQDEGSWMPHGLPQSGKATITAGC